MRARAIVLAGFVGVAIAAAGCREPADTQAANVEPPPDQQAAAGPVSERSKPTVPDETATHEFTECERAVIRLIGDDPDKLSGSVRSHMVADMELFSDGSADTGDTWLKLAGLQVHFGHFGDARTSLDRAKKMGVDKTALAKSEQQWRDAKRLRDQFGTCVPDRQSIIAVDEFSVPRQGRLRAVLTGRPCFPFFPLMTGYGLPHVTVVRMEGGAPKELWRSDEFVGPGFESGYGYLEITQRVAHVGGGRPDALVLAFQGLAGDSSPAHAKVLEWRDGGLAETLAADSNYDMQISDLNGDGVPEITTHREVGVRGGGVPLNGWTDIYGWADGKWGPVGERFPEKYEQIARDLRLDLKRSPHDPERWYYLGMALQNAGQAKEAIAAYRESLELFEQYIRLCEQNDYDYEAATARQDRDDAVKRIAALDGTNGG